VVRGTSNIGDPVTIDCHDIFGGNSVKVTPDNFAEIMKTTVKVSNREVQRLQFSTVFGVIWCEFVDRR